MDTTAKNAVESYLWRFFVHFFLDKYEYVRIFFVYFAVWSFRSTVHEPMLGSFIFCVYDSRNYRDTPSRARRVDVLG